MLLLNCKTTSLSAITVETHDSHSTRSSALTSLLTGCVRRIKQENGSK